MTQLRTGGVARSRTARPSLRSRHTSSCSRLWGVLGALKSQAWSHVLSLRSPLASALYRNSTPLPSILPTVPGSTVGPLPCRWPTLHGTCTHACTERPPPAVRGTPHPQHACMYRTAACMHVSHSSVHACIAQQRACMYRTATCVHVSHSSLHARIAHRTAACMHVSHGSTSQVDSS